MKHGNNNAACGAPTEPCKTLNFTFKLIQEMTGYNIHLDGGNSDPLTYFMPPNVAVKNVKIVNYDNSTRNPVILSRSVKPIFEVSGKFHLVSINFEKLSVASTTNNAKASLNFLNCYFNNSRIVENDKIRSKSTVVYISSSKIYSKPNTPPFLQFNNSQHIQLNIKGSQVYGSGIFISGTNFKLQIIKSNFEKFNLTLQTAKLHKSTYLGICGCVFLKSNLTLNGYGKARLERDMFNASTVTARTWRILHIYQTSFTNNNKMHLLLRDLGYVEIVHSIVWGNNGRGTVLCMRIKTLHVTNCTFENNHFKKMAKSLNNFECDGGALCLKHVKSTVIDKSKFQNNSGVQGGAIYMSQSTVSIKNTNLFYNTALLFGGALYSEGNNRITLKNSVIQGPYSTRLTPLTGHLIFSKTAMKLDNSSFFVNSNNLVNTVVIYIDTIQELRSKKHTLILSSYYLQCPVGYNVDASYWIEPKSKQYRLISSKCAPCGSGKYNLNYGYSYKTKKMVNIKQSNVTCLSCPSGGVCNNKIESAGNYWGYVDKNDNVRFIPCPINYCCTRYGTLCSSYNTCEKNRNGKLCGACKPGYSLDFLSSRCIANGNCTVLSSITFWLLYIAGACLYVFLLMYLREITLSFRKCLNFSEVKKILKVERDLEPSPEPRINIASINTTEISNCLIDVVKEDIADSNISSQSGKNFPSLDAAFERQDTDVINSAKRASGLIKIIFFFYQIEAILRVNAPLKSKYRYKPWLINSLISSVFNINIYPENTWFSACPINGLTTVKKQFVRISFIGVMFGVLIVLYFSGQVLGLYKKSVPTRNKHKCCYLNAVDDQIPAYAELPHIIRVKSCVIKLCLLGYMAISTFLLKCLHCVNIDNSFSLYIQGENDCVSSWYYWVVIFIVIVWVAPFCIVLWGGSKLLYSCKISPNEFFLILIFPPISAYYYWRTKQEGVIVLTKEDAMEAKHYLMELYEPFQRDASTSQCTMWECMLIFRKMFLVIIYTVVIHPIGKLYTLLFLLVIYLIHHIYQQPYYDKFLNFVESVSLVVLCFLAAVNLFWAQIYMMNESNVPQFSVIGEVCLHFELLVLVLPVIIVGIAVVRFLSIRLMRYYNHSGLTRIVSRFQRGGDAVTCENPNIDEEICDDQEI